MYQRCICSESVIHLSKTNAFYRHPNIVFVHSQAPLSPFSMLKYAPWTLSRVTTLKRGVGVEMWKLEIENSRVQRKQVFWGECLNYFCPWLSELYFIQWEAFSASAMFCLLSSTWHHCLANYKPCRAPVECNYYVTEVNYWQGLFHERKYVSFST